MVGLLDGEKTLRICVTVYTQYRRVTDKLRQTDGQASCHCIFRAMHTRRAVKTISAIFFWQVTYDLTLNLYRHHVQRENSVTFLDMPISQGSVAA